MGIWLYPNDYNVTSFASMLQYIDYVSAGWFGIILLITLFVVMMISLKRYENAKALAASSFICFLVSLLLRALNMVPSLAIVVFITLAIIASLYYEFRGS